MIYPIISKHNETYSMMLLNRDYCVEHYDEILSIVNIIPHIRWTERDLLSQEEDYYHDKWNYSYAILKDNKIIGVLIAYFRLADDRHIFDSLYVHRFAIIPEYQRRGIGTEVLKRFIDVSFESIPWLLNISLQTNDAPENEYVIRFYSNMGFRKMYMLHYPNKTDIVYLLEKKDTIPRITKAAGYTLSLKHPRLDVQMDCDKRALTLPVVFFSSTNTRKKEIVKFIFHNYNIEVRFITLPIELTEPQLEKGDIDNERKLVSFPLKHASRFITSTPCIIEDTMLFVEFFNRNGSDWELPGLDTKRWLRQLGLDGLIEIMGDTSLRKARFVSQTGAFVKSDEYCFGRGELLGTIAREKSIIDVPQYGTYPYFFHLLFIPDGSNKTLAEMDMHEYAKYDYMRKSIIQLIDNISKSGFLTRPYDLYDYLIEKDELK